MSIQSSPKSRGNRPPVTVRNSTMYDQSNLSSSALQPIPSNRTGYSSDAKLLLHKGRKHALEGPRRLLQLHQTLKASGTYFIFGFSFIFLAELLLPRLELRFKQLVIWFYVVF